MTWLGYARERFSKQPLACGRVRTWARLLWENGCVEPRYLPRAGFVSAMTLLGAPFRKAEQLRFDSLIKSTAICEAPIFVIGHWRSGTTLLHNYLVQDPEFGFMSTLQGVMLDTCMIRHNQLRAVVLGLLPSHRPMDSVPLGLVLPSEEELPMALMSPYSYYHALFFPQAMRTYFDRYVLFGKEADVQAWRAQYFQLLQKASYLAEGRRLVLKNPPNTGRIATLLAMFPKARFIHIYRNPYRVFYSTRHLYANLLDITAFQQIDKATLDANIIHIYRALLQRYLHDTALIPPGQLTEVRYEALLREPVGELERVYAELGMDGFEHVADRFHSFAASQRTFQKNHFAVCPKSDRLVTREWAFALDLWGYNGREAA